MTITRKHAKLETHLTIFADRRNWRMKSPGVSSASHIYCRHVIVSHLNLIFCLFCFLRATVILRLGHASPSQFSVKNLLLAKSLFVFTTSSLCFHLRYVPHPRECPLSLLTPNIPLVNLSTDCHPFPRNIVRRV